MPLLTKEERTTLDKSAKHALRVERREDRQAERQAEREAKIVAGMVADIEPGDPLAFWYIRQRIGVLRFIGRIGAKFDAAAFRPPLKAALLELAEGDDDGVWEADEIALELANMVTDKIDTYLTWPEGPISMVLEMLDGPMLDIFNKPLADYIEAVLADPAEPAFDVVALGIKVRGLIA